MNFVYGMLVVSAVVLFVYQWRKLEDKPVDEQD
jgi:hypothetical protein